MKNETVEQFFIKDAGDFDKSAIIQTDQQFYKISYNRFDVLVSPDLSEFEVDSYWNIIGTKIMDIGTDGIYTLVELSDNRFIHCDMGGDCIDIGVYPPVEYEENHEWLKNGMQKLSVEHNYLSNDWVRPD